MPLWQTRKRLTEPDWEALYGEWAPRGLRFALGYLPSHADAEEAVQEAFCRLWLSRTWDRRPETLGPFFFATIRNFAIDMLRRRGRRPSVSMTSMGDLVDHRHPDPEPLCADAVRRLMDDLPDPWRDALRLRVDGGLAYLEIAQVLGCTAAQVRTWIYRARRQLADQLGEQGRLHRMGAQHESVP